MLASVSRAKECHLGAVEHGREGDYTERTQRLADSLDII